MEPLLPSRAVQGRIVCTVLLVIVLRAKRNIVSALALQLYGVLSVRVDRKTGKYARCALLSIKDTFVGVVML
jgi:hypothetical protein